MQTISAINSVTLSSATGILTGSGSTNVSDGDTVTIGTTVYRFKNTMAQINDIQIGGSGNSDTSLNNLIDAINGTGSAGTNWYAGTVANTQVTAGALTSHAFTVTAIQAGIYGSQIATTKSSTVLSWGATTLTGGTTVTIVATVSMETFIQPSKISTVPEYPANPNWSRTHKVTNAAHFIIRNGGNSVAMQLPELSDIAVILEPSLSWAPYVQTAPLATTCAGSVAATGTLTGSGSTNVSDGDTVTIGTTVYRFKNTMAQANDVQIGGSGNSDTSLQNLIYAINANPTYAGTSFFNTTPANTQVTAGTLSAHAFTVTAIKNGLAGNAIATTKSSTPLSWGASTLASGADSAASFVLVAGATESTITYQWQYLNGTTWTNISSGSGINGTVYSGYTTATLTCTPSTTGQTGVQHRCLMTNASGSVYTTPVALTIS